MFYDFMDSRLNVRRQLLWPQQKKYYCLISCKNSGGGALRTIRLLFSIAIKAKEDLSHCIYRSSRKAPPRQADCSSVSHFSFDKSLLAQYIMLL